MSKIKGEDVKEFVWGVCGILAELDVTKAEPGYEYTGDELQDRFGVALLANPSLFEFLDDLCSINQVVEFIESTIEGFGYVPCGSVQYIEALLLNPSLFKLVTGA